MKIKIAILEKDLSYLSRLTASFGTKYADKVQIYSFTNVENALKTIVSEKIDVFLASDSFEINPSTIPERCAFAFFVDASDIDTINDQRAICKFQKADLIYRQILSIYSEKAGNLTGIKADDGNCKVIAFVSLSGGTGTSSMAGACAMHLSGRNSKVLYLNLEKFGSSDTIFTADGQFNMSDIIFALKSKKSNISMKLESCVKQDNSGVFFFSQSQTALDMFELSNEDVLRLINEIKLSGVYDYIILDIDFSLDKLHIDIMRLCHSIVVVGDGSDFSNLKIFRGYNALKIIEENDDSAKISNKMYLIYNKFSNKTGSGLDNIDLRILNGAPRYEHATSKQIIKQLSQLAVFETIAE